MQNGGWILDVATRGGTKASPWGAIGFLIVWSCMMTYFAVREVRAWRRHRQFTRGGMRGGRRYKVLVETAVRGEVPVSGTGPCAIGFAASSLVRSFQLD